MAKNVNLNVELSYKQRRGIAALMLAGSVKAAAKIAKISERQLHRWLLEPAFKDALQKAQDNALAATVRALTDAGPLAALTLRNVMNNPSAKNSDRVRASNVNLTNLMRMTELSELADRVSELERQNAKR
jgi:hypothetical protein